MPKYEVLATNHQFYSIVVEADSVLEANQIASDTSLDQWSNDDEELELHLDNTEQVK